MEALSIKIDVTKILTRLSFCAINMACLIEVI